MATHSMIGLRRFALTLLLFAAADPSAWALEVGASAPQIQLPNQQGDMQALFSQTSPLTYVDFWASWCGPCRQSFPFMNEMQDKYRHKGLRIVAVNVDQRPRDASAFLRNTPAHFDVLYDPQGKSPRAFQVKAMPSSYLIDAQGRIIARHMGFTADSKPEIEALIESKLRGQN